jgi:hypothetical protein
MAGKNYSRKSVGTIGNPEEIQRKSMVGLAGASSLPSSTIIKHFYPSSY